MANEENKIVKACLEILNRIPQCKAWRNNQIHVRGRTFNGLLGVGDIIGCYRGRFLSVECKTKTGKASKEQDKFIEDITNIGGIAITVNNVSDLLEKIKG